MNEPVFGQKCRLPKNLPKNWGFQAKPMVDKIETKCLACGTVIHASVLEGDPGYILTSNAGRESLFLPQGSTAKPVSELSAEQQISMIAAIKADMASREKSKKRK